jgi:hypothetical protein
MHVIDFFVGLIFLLRKTESYVTNLQKIGSVFFVGPLGLFLDLKTGSIFMIEYDVLIISKLVYLYLNNT